MNGLIPQHVDSVLIWLAEYSSFSFALVVVVQIGSIAVLAKLMAAAFVRRDASLTYGVWLSAVIFVLAIVPIHYVIGSRSIRVTNLNKMPGAKSYASKCRN